MRSEIKIFTSKHVGGINYFIHKTRYIYYRVMLSSAVSFNLRYVLIRWLIFVVEIKKPMRKCIPLH